MFNDDIGPIGMLKKILADTKLVILLNKSGAVSF